MVWWEVFLCCFCHSFISYERALVPLHKRKVASVGTYPPVRTSKDMLSLLGVRNLALSYGSRHMGFRGIGTGPGEHIYLHHQFTFCFWSIHAVHLTVYTVPSW
jgi:hypothetical protein